MEANWIGEEWNSYISLFFFANDLVLFVEASLEEAEMIRYCLDKTISLFGGKS